MITDDEVGTTLVEADGLVVDSNSLDSLFLITNVVDGVGWTIIQRK